MMLKVLLACATVASLCSGIAYGQALPGAWNSPTDPQARMQAWHGAAREHEFVPPIPRGDLRNDIENHAHTRLDQQAHDAHAGHR